MIGEMLRPFRLDQVRTTLRARDGDKRLQQCEAFDHDASLTLLQ